MEKIRTVVLGTGVFGALHARFYHECPLTELVAVVNRTEAKGRAVAQQYGVPWYKTVEEVVEKEDFLLASVCTGEEMHLHQGRVLANAGKKILMEKPLAPTIEEVDEMIKYVEDTGAFMDVNYILHNDPRFLEIKRMCDNHNFGDHISYFARHRGGFAGALYYGPWTDILISTAIHDIDLMCWFNGTKPVRVFAEAIIKKCAEINTYDAVVATIKFENGAIGCLETSWVMAETLPGAMEFSFHLIGSKDSAMVDGYNNGLSIVGEKKYYLPDMTFWPVLTSGLQGNLRASMESVVKSVITGGKPFQSPQQARASHEIVFAMRKSIETNLPVELK